MGGGGVEAGSGGVEVFLVFFLPDWVQQSFVEQNPAVFDVLVVLQLQFQQLYLFIDRVLALQLCNRDGCPQCILC